MLKYGPRKHVLASNTVSTVQTVCDDISIKIVNEYGENLVYVSPVNLFIVRKDSLDRTPCLHHWVDIYNLVYCLPSDFPQMDELGLAQICEQRPEYMKEIVKRKVQSFYPTYNQSQTPIKNY